MKKSSKVFLALALLALFLADNVSAGKRRACRRAYRRSCRCVQRCYDSCYAQYKPVTVDNVKTYFCPIIPLSTGGAGYFFYGHSHDADCSSGWNCNGYECDSPVVTMHDLPVSQQWPIYCEYDHDVSCNYDSGSDVLSCCLPTTFKQDQTKSAEQEFELREPITNNYTWDKFLEDYFANDEVRKGVTRISDNEVILTRVSSKTGNRVIKTRIFKFLYDPSKVDLPNVNNEGAPKIVQIGLHTNQAVTNPSKPERPTEPGVKNPQRHTIHRVRKHNQHPILIFTNS